MISSVGWISTLIHRTTNNSMLLFLRFWSMAMVGRCLNPAEHCAENMLRLRSTDSNGGEFRKLVTGPQVGADRVPRWGD